MTSCVADFGESLQVVKRRKFWYANSRCLSSSDSVEGYTPADVQHCYEQTCKVQTHNIGTCMVWHYRHWIPKCDQQADLLSYRCRLACLTAEGTYGTYFDHTLPKHVA